MATIVHFDEIWVFDKKTRIFQTLNGGPLWVSSFENGIAIVNPVCGCNIAEFSKMIAGCFEEESNFKSALCDAFNCDSETALIGIQFEFNEGTVQVTKENANTEQIVAEWRAGLDANFEKYRLEM